MTKNRFHPPYSFDSSTLLFLTRKNKISFICQTQRTVAPRWNNLRPRRICEDNAGEPRQRSLMYRSSLGRIQRAIVDVLSTMLRKPGHSFACNLHVVVMVQRILFQGEWHPYKSLQQNTLLVWHLCMESQALVASSRRMRKTCLDQKADWCRATAVWCLSLPVITHHNWPQIQLSKTRQPTHLFSRLLKTITSQVARWLLNHGNPMFTFGTTHQFAQPDQSPKCGFSHAFPRFQAADGYLFADHVNKYCEVMWISAIRIDANHHSGLCSSCQSIIFTRRTLSFIRTSAPSTQY